VDQRWHRACNSRGDRLRFYAFTRLTLNYPIAIRVTADTRAKELAEGNDWLEK
jgi:hypothetical protein